jgi:hypothetical protein
MSTRPKDGSTGKTGTLDRVGADYLAIFNSHSMYQIPFNAIATIVDEMIKREKGAWEKRRGMNLESWPLPILITLALRPSWLRLPHL